jgi:hypothetical protein
VHGRQLIALLWTQRAKSVGRDFPEQILKDLSFQLLTSSSEQFSPRDEKMSCEGKGRLLLPYNGAHDASKQRQPLA